MGGVHWVVIECRVVWVKLDAFKLDSLGCFGDLERGRLVQRFGTGDVSCSKHYDLVTIR